MTDGREFDEYAIYQIRVKGNLDQKWEARFDGFKITPLANHETRLTGLVADQAALHGILARIRDLGLPLLLVKREKKRRAGAFIKAIQELIKKIKKWTQKTSSPKSMEGFCRS
jgi:hypothetical protein